MTDEMLIDMARRVSGDLSRACTLLQGYHVTSFAGFSEAGLDLPPQHTNPGWDLFRDIRVFGPQGEGHFVRTGPNQWISRFLRADGTEPYVDRSFRIWGTGDPQRIDGWARYSEANGAVVWLPERFAVGAPLFLNVREIFGYEPNRGIAGVVDAMILGFAKEALV